MASDYLKIEFKCDCGQDYGSCNKTSAYYYKYIHSVDIAQLYYKHDISKSEFEYLGSFNDTQLEFLNKILNSPNESNYEDWTEEEIQMTK